MKILYVTGENKVHHDVTQQLREKNYVDHIFLGSSWKIIDGDYYVPKLFGRHIGFRFLSSIVTHWLLFTKTYDFCVTSTENILRPVVAVILKSIGFFRKTSFIHDLRTIPVDYPEHLAARLHKKLAAELRFVDRFYQGLALGTDEMKRYLDAQYGPIKKPTCTWGQSGVMESDFRPMPGDAKLRSSFGFDPNDFIIFYHGSFGNTRGVVELIQGFALSRSEHRDIRLLLVGSGVAEGRMRDSIQKLGLNGAAVIQGQVEKKRVPSLISIADLCVVPLSDIDWWRTSSPLKLMEYIACGKTILLTEMIAHTTVVGNTSNYFWFKDVTPESISQALKVAYRSFREDPQQYYRRGRIEREKHIHEITWKARISSLEQFLFTLQKV